MYTHRGATLLDYNERRGQTGRTKGAFTEQRPGMYYEGIALATGTQGRRVRWGSH